MSPIVGFKLVQNWIFCLNTQNISCSSSLFSALCSFSILLIWRSWADHVLVFGLHHPDWGKKCKCLGDNDKKTQPSAALSPFQFGKIRRTDSATLSQPLRYQFQSGIALFSECSAWVWNIPMGYLVNLSKGYMLGNQMPAVAGGTVVVRNAISNLSRPCSVFIISGLFFVFLPKFLALWSMLDNWPPKWKQLYL